MTEAVRVLLLDDSETDALLTRMELEATGSPFRFERVNKPTDFLQALEKFKPQLILSDYTLDAMEGAAALDIIRRKKIDIPFIFVSWRIHDESIIDVMKKGATDYIFKDQLSRLTFSVFRALREAEERAELLAAHQIMLEQERLRALGQMASGIAHDFSNALTPVMGFSEILLNHTEMLDDKKQVEEYLQIMNTSA